MELPIVLARDERVGVPTGEKALALQKRLEFRRRKLLPLLERWVKAVKGGRLGRSQLRNARIDSVRDDADIGDEKRRQPANRQDQCCQNPQKPFAPDR